MISTAAGVFRLFLLLLWSMAALPPYLLLAAGSRRHPAYCAGFWRVALRLIGLRVVVRGTPLAGGPALFVANHASYFDVAVLGGLVPAAFVAETAVAGWPLFGILARIARAAFIDPRPGAAARGRDRLRRRIDEGVSLVLFPEGARSDGNRVLPFKSAALAVAERPFAGPDGTVRALPVQPVSVAYTRLDGLPLCRAFRPLLACYGAMGMPRHLLRALGLGVLTVEVQFHPPVTAAQFGGRKGLARHCHATVHQGVTLALAGRLPPG